MAHTNLHLAQGLAIGSALTIIPLARAWLAAAPVARPLLRLTIASLALAVWAAAPIILHRLGAPAGVHTARWADIFLGHASIDRRFGGGLLLGEVAIVAWLGAVYLIAVAAVIRARRRQTATTPPSTRSPRT